MKKWMISRVDDFRKKIKIFFGKEIFSLLDSLTGAYSQAVFFRDFEKENLYKKLLY